MVILLEFEHVGVSYSMIWQKSQPCFIYDLFIFWKTWCILTSKRQCSFDNCLRKKEEKGKGKKLKTFLCSIIGLFLGVFVITQALCQTYNGHRYQLPFFFFFFVNWCEWKL